MLERSGSVLVLLATLAEDGAPTWQGLFLDPTSWRSVGPAVARSETARALELAEPSASLVDLLVAASISCSERFESLGRELDELETRHEHPGAEELSRLQRALLQAHKHLARLERLQAELEGPLGNRFPGVARTLPSLEAETARTADIAAGLLQAVRDLVVLRTGLESNRLARSANELGRASNEIAALANTSNVRMLGVAYVALAIALVSVVVLIPNTAATILGMPSAAWVPGLVVDAVLVLLAVVPLAVVFSRPWVRRMLSGWSSFETRSAEGMGGLTELSPAEAARPRDAERLIRERP